MAPGTNLADLNLPPTTAETSSIAYFGRSSNSHHFDNLAYKWR
jgi:hypothetical protein